MPLESGRSESAFHNNVAELIRAGHPREQALAIAFKKQRGEDSGPITAREYDLNGWPEIKGNPLSKVGVFPYLGKTISSELQPDQIYYVYRPEEELADPETIQSFRLLPWVDDHPDDLLGPEAVNRIPAEQKGIEGVIGEAVYYDPTTKTLRGNIKLFSDNLADLIENGKRELSIGYGCRYEVKAGEYEGQPYQVIQRNIRGNHVATVSAGRMGPDVKVLDEASKLTFTIDAKDFKMPDTKKDDEKAMTMEDAAGWMKDNLPMMKKMQDMWDKHMGAKDAKEDEDKKGEAADKAKDADTKEDEGEQKEGGDKAKDKAKDAASCDADKDDEDKKAADKAAKDSADLRKQVTAIAQDVADFKANTFKRVMGEIKQRDELAGRLSNFVGAFDSSEMTLGECAAYGAEKLGLKPEKGQELSAVNAYLHNRKAPSESVGFSHDANAGLIGASNVVGIQKFIAEKMKAA